MKYLAIAVLALSTVACSEGMSTIGGALPSPTVIATTANAVCGTHITSLDLDVNYAGPYLTIDIAFAGDPQPVQIEIERYLGTGQTELVASLQNVVGHTRVDLAFNTKYRVRARAGSCTTWSPWVDREIGPPNPCGDCTRIPPPPPPPPEPPAEEPPPPCPDWDLVFTTGGLNNQGVWSMVCGEEIRLRTR